MSERSEGRAARRRDVLRAGLAGGAAALAAPAIATAQGQTTTWRVQTSWPGGAGRATFDAWCASIVEKTGGELAFEPHGPGDLVGAFEIYDGLKAGALEAVNPFTIYAQDMIPAAKFLTSYPMGLRAPHEFDTFYYGLGGLEIARELYQRQGLQFVGPIHHGPNIIHSKVRITSFDDFRGLRMRTPGGMVAELFEELGAETVTLPGSEIFPALEADEIDCADYVGPAVNYELGFSSVCPYISMGPPGFMSVYQPVDLMDLTVALDAWNALSPEMQQFVEMEVQSYSDRHHAAIQAADQDAWKKFEADGVEVTRLVQEDVRLLTKIALPIWLRTAKPDPDAARVLRIQLDYMASGSLGYLDRTMQTWFESEL
jgi:TRAP-type mannitol/chloroaromatic compound transport system substrate-binding protein